MVNLELITHLDESGDGTGLSAVVHFTDGDRLSVQSKDLEQIRKYVGGSRPADAAKAIVFWTVILAAIVAVYIAVKISR